MHLDDGRGNWLELHIVGYEFPDFDWRRGIWDANWLVVEGGASLDGRRWNFRDPSLPASEARDLANWLDQAADGQAKEEVNFMEPNLAFGPLADRQGIYVKLGNESRPPWVEDLDGIEVSLAVTGNQLSSAAAAIRSELREFPWRGPTQGDRDNLNNS
jgi:hypothetical protein